MTRDHQVEPRCCIGSYTRAVLKTYPDMGSAAAGSSHYISIIVITVVVLVLVIGDFAIVKLG